jgi:hypothetical protein
VCVCVCVCVIESDRVLAISTCSPDLCVIHRALHPLEVGSSTKELPLCPDKDGTQRLLRVSLV